MKEKILMRRKLLMKENKDDRTNLIAEIVPYLLIILGVFFLVMWHTKGGQYLYGTFGDWSEQHISIPELFRREFYKTGNLLPDFFPQVGGGQNAWYFAYYGLLSPVILLSYLLPFVSMRKFLIIAAISAQIISSCLIYQWLRRSYRIMPALTAALFFCFASGFSHHVYFHIMFIIYMPFFIMALRSLEGQISRGKSPAGFIIWMSLAVLCCYFFSVSEFLAAGVFSIFLGLRQADSNGGNAWKEIFSAVGKLIFDAIVVILITAVLWLPALHTLLGRESEQTHVTIISLFVPVFHSEYIMYGTGSLGASAILIIVLTYMLIKKGHSFKWLSMIFLILSFIALPVYIMNGGMYFHGKVLIPFLPLMSIMYAQFLDDVISKNIPWKKLLIIAIPLAVYTFISFGNFKRRWFAWDFCLALIVLIFISLLLKHWKKYPGMLMTLLVIPAILVAARPDSINGNLVPRGWGKDLPTFQKSSGAFRTSYLMGEHTPINLPITDNDYIPMIYSSVENPYYSDYFKNKSGNEMRYRNAAKLFQAFNPYFCAQMGIRYIITDCYKDYAPEKIYHLVSRQGKYCLYENDNVLPLAYSATSECNMNDEKRELISVKGLQSSMRIKTKKTQKKVFHLEPSDYDRIIRVSFAMKNNGGTYKKWFGVWERKGMQMDLQGDVKIDINHVRNVRTSPNAIYDNWNKTFKYTMVIPAHSTKLTFNFHHGDYQLNNIKVTQVPVSAVVEKVHSVKEVPVDTKSSKENILTLNGSLDSNKAIYTSVPYDNGFSAAVDGKPVAVKKTKLGFLSISGNWNTGKHRVVITFNAPGKRSGMGISLIGLILLAAIIIKNAIIDRKVSHAEK
ncbi:MAG: YfhO family protein [bacterium LCO1.1]|uniref:YfhO family protein n=1 Tax=Candidatus Weimeria bifida TaxID=2599074 RepID=A0A6N7IYB1_9FIRM|nr:YfhO family protein [Candidatus Weimeria bifida]